MSGEAREPRRSPAAAPVLADGGGLLEDRGLSGARRVLALSHAVRERLWQVVAVAVGLWALGLVARMLADDALPAGFPYVTFFPAVLISGFLGGLACGVICATLSGLTAWYLYIPPFMSFDVSTTVVVALIFYLFVVGAGLALIHYLYKALDETSRDRERLGELLAQRTTLVTELQHRVSNNLAFVSSLFAMQKRRLKGNAEAVAAFDDARLRLTTMARLHRRLYDPAAGDVAFETILHDMLRTMLDMADRHDVALSLDVAALPLPAERKMTLALFALEATTNALKHAFAGRAGRLHVELARIDAERAVIRVRDDGPGWAEGRLEPRGDQTERSLGLRVLGSFANAVQGELELANDGGAVVGIVFPLASGSVASPAAVMGA